jgi:hypothetical protein
MCAAECDVRHQQHIAEVIYTLLNSLAEIRESAGAQRGVKYDFTALFMSHKKQKFITPRDVRRKADIQRVLLTTKCIQQENFSDILLVDSKSFNRIRNGAVQLHIYIKLFF